MILSSTETIPGREVVEILGLVRGNTVRARHLGRDISAAFRHIVGGEIDEYPRARPGAGGRAPARRPARPRALGAAAVRVVRFSSAGVMKTAAEVIASGTAVRRA
ncbi:MAG: heavy metal-binding domain-containing protein [Planctomycetes bacterium]|nr:heavy metal-binding domain-containing protein [Planctomycetota bacterium]